MAKSRQTKGPERKSFDGLSALKRCKRDNHGCRDKVRPEERIDSTLYAFANGRKKAAEECPGGRAIHNGDVNCFVHPDFDSLMIVATDSVDTHGFERVCVCVCVGRGRPTVSCQLRGAKGLPSKKPRSQNVVMHMKLQVGTES